MRKHLEDYVSVRTLEQEHQANRSMICRWMKRYIAEGESSFERKKPPGNRFAALHTGKNLSEVERLRLMVVKLEIENERLKKGYWVEGAGASKEFVTGKGKNMRLYGGRFLCEVMGVKRSGYYKWKSRQGKMTRYEWNGYC